MTPGMTGALEAVRGLWLTPGVRRVLIVLLLGFAAGTAHAEVEPLPERVRGPVMLAPGVTLGRLERPGPQVIHILRAKPRGGRNALRVDSAGPSTLDRGSVSEFVRRRRAAGAVVGLNGDFFNFRSGHPSGILITSAGLINEPEPRRTSLAVTADGLLAAVQPMFLGSWEALDAAGNPTGVSGAIDGLNRPAERGRETLLYTPGIGQATPGAGSRFEATITLDAPSPLLPNTPVTGIVVDAGPRGGHPFVAEQVVVSGVGADGPEIVAGLPVGSRVRITPTLSGLPADTVAAIGGGPELVRGGVAIADSGEAFSPGQLDPPAPRSAVGQRADGTVILVAAEGRPHGSQGMTTPELATLMAQLGSVTAVAMDSGGSASLATVSGSVLPGSERRVSNALSVHHDGVTLETPPRRRLTPNGDGVAESLAPSVSVSRAGVLTVSVARRNGATRRITRRRVAPTVRRVRLDPARLRLSDGPYRLTAELVPADGSPVRTHFRDLVVDRTLGHLRVRPRSVRVGNQRQARADIQFRLSRAAKVTVRIEDADGRRLRTLVSNRQFRKGEQTIAWNRRAKGRLRIGTHRIVVEARSPMGQGGLVETIDLPEPDPSPVAPPVPL